MISSLFMLEQKHEIHGKGLVKLAFYVDGEIVHTTPWTNLTMDIDFRINLTGAGTLRIAIVGEENYVENCIALTGLELS